jgi:DNA invertase Pin-like site-specific DNA recombinase
MFPVEGSCQHLVVWRLDRLGRRLHHVVTAGMLSEHGIGLKVLTRQDAQRHNNCGRPALAEFEPLLDIPCTNR